MSTRPRSAWRIRHLSARALSVGDEVTWQLAEGRLWGAGSRWQTRGIGCVESRPPWWDEMEVPREKLAVRGSNGALYALRASELRRAPECQCSDDRPVEQCPRCSWRSIVMEAVTA